MQYRSKSPRANQFLHLKSRLSRITIFDDIHCVKTNAERIMIFMFMFNHCSQATDMEDMTTV